MNKKSQEQPFQVLGEKLRRLRQKLRESAVEVSGAVEIDVDSLERIEQGLELPSEDILMLLISHFGLGDDEAVGLWELAGYDQREKMWEQNPQRDDVHFAKQAVILLALDARALYSNGVEIVSDKSGVVMNFTQFTDKSQGSITVARIGMSYEQAERVLATLQRALLHEKYMSGPKGLPVPRVSSRKIKKQQKDIE